MNPKPCAALLVAVLAWPAAPAIALQEDDPRDSGVTERVQVRLVEMAILARDRRGDPITDLGAEEIVVKERGRTLKVQYLEPFAKPAYDEPAPDVRLQIQAPGGVVARAAPLEREPAYFIIVVDVETDWRLQKNRALDDAVRFVSENLEPHYRVAVFTYNGKLNQESTFTDDVETLKAALSSAYDRAPRPEVDVYQRVNNLIRSYGDCVVETGAFISKGDELCILGVAQEYAEERRPLAIDYIDALESIVRLASGLRGRKTVMVLGHGIPTNTSTEAIEAAKSVFGNTDQLARIQLQIGSSDDARMEMDRLIDTAIDHKVTMHFVDRSLVPSDVSARHGSGSQPGARPVLAAFEAPQYDLEEIATHTGGIFVGSPGELYEGLKEAIDVEQGGYNLGYYVDGFRTRAQLAKVKVGTTRKGVRISHRRGAFEAPPSSGFAGGITFGAQHPVEDGRDARYVEVTFEANPYLMDYEVFKEYAEAHFTLHVTVQSANGRIVADAFHFLTHAYPRDVWDLKSAEPVTLQGIVEAPPGQYRVSAFIHNSRTGRSGEMSAELVVPETAATAQPGGAE